MSSLFSGLSGLTDKITSFIREPVSSLGNAINDAINATYGVVSTDKYMRFADMVNATSDPEVLEEVWFVLAKGIGSSTNSTVRITMQICDVLMKNTGSRFHNACTPLFMRRCKEMIIDRSKTGGADNMHVANEAKNMIRLWGDAFMPYASSGRGRVIVEGYQDMQRDGIRFPPLPNDTKWEPPINPPRRAPERSYSNSYSSSSSKPSRSTVDEGSDDFDPKETYKMLKKLMAKYEDEGNSIFENQKIVAFVERCKGNSNRLQRIIERESMKDDNENYLSHLLTLNDMIIKITGIYKKYQDSKKKMDDDWSDDDVPSTKKKANDGWSDDEDDSFSKPSMLKAASTQSDGPSIRSTGRRTRKESDAPSRTRPSPKKNYDDLFDSDEETNTRANPTKQPKKNYDDLFDSDEGSAPSKPAAPKNSKPWNEDDDEEWDIQPSSRSRARAQKSANTKAMNKNALDALFDDDDDMPAKKPAKKAPQPAKSANDDLFDVDFLGSSAPAAASEPVDLMDEMDLSTIDFSSSANPVPVSAPAPVKPKASKPAKSKSTFDDLFDL